MKRGSGTPGGVSEPLDYHVTLSVEIIYIPIASC